MGVYNGEEMSHLREFYAEVLVLASKSLWNLKSPQGRVHPRKGSNMPPEFCPQKKQVGP